VTSHIEIWYVSITSKGGAPQPLTFYAHSNLVSRISIVLKSLYQFIITLVTALYKISSIT